MADAAHIEVFTAIGALKRDFSEDEVSGLSPEHRDRFFALVKAANADEDAEAEVVAAKADEAQCVRDLTAAEEEHQRQNPPSNFLQELRKVQNRPRE